MKPASKTCIEMPFQVASTSNTGPSSKVDDATIARHRDTLADKDELIRKLVWEKTDLARNLQQLKEREAHSSKLLQGAHVQKVKAELKENQAPAAPAAALLDTAPEIEHQPIQLSSGFSGTATDATAQPQDRSKPTLRRQLHGYWVELESVDGEVYYANRITQETSWEMPASLVGVSRDSREVESPFGAALTATLDFIQTATQNTMAGGTSDPPVSHPTVVTQKW